VLPYDPATDRIVLVEQFRIGAYAAGFPSWQLEAIAGMLAPGETPEQVVRREAREEADLDISALEPVARYLSSPGLSESVTLFCGRTDARAAGGIHGLKRTRISRSRYSREASRSCWRIRWRPTR
jgi:ADP-ribose pyrophosphatase